MTNTPRHDQDQAWLASVKPDDLGPLVQQAVELGHLNARRPSLLLYDLELLGGRLAALRSAFPPGTLHALAVKANPVVEILAAAVAEGAGLECASLEEVELALAANCPPERIVFDSPAKTMEDLHRTIGLGVTVNADSVDELARIAEVLGGREPKGVIGLRIRTQVGAGRIAATSVGDARSRFGALLSTPGELTALLRRFSFVTGLHSHVGSQGCALGQLVEGTRQIASLAKAANQDLGRTRVRVLDIGGGLPAAYDGRPVPTPREYMEALQAAIPDWAAPPFRLITEFGRAVHAGCGTAISRIEYVKNVGDRSVAVVHLGADFMMRPAYFPQAWQHRFALLDATGRLVSAGDADDLPTGASIDIAGPLCFAGDVIGHAVPLPVPRPGQYLAIRDVGAYTLSMWSRHCSRALPAVLGHRGPAVAGLLFAGEQPSDVVSFWSARR